MLGQAILARMPTGARLPSRRREINISDRGTMIFDFIKERFRAIRPDALEGWKRRDDANERRERRSIIFNMAGHIVASAVIAASG